MTYLRKYKMALQNWYSLHSCPSTHVSFSLYLHDNLYPSFHLHAQRIPKQSMLMILQPMLQVLWSSIERLFSPQLTIKHILRWTCLHFLGHQLEKPTSGGPCLQYTWHSSYNHRKSWRFTISYEIGGYTSRITSSVLWTHLKMESMDNKKLSNFLLQQHSGTANYVIICIKLPLQFKLTLRFCYIGEYHINAIQVSASNSSHILLFYSVSKRHYATIEKLHTNCSSCNDSLFIPLRPINPLILGDVGPQDGHGLVAPQTIGQLLLLGFFGLPGSSILGQFRGRITLGEFWVRRIVMEGESSSTITSIATEF